MNLTKALQVCRFHCDYFSKCPDVTNYAQALLVFWLAPNLPDPKLSNLTNLWFMFIHVHSLSFIGTCSIFIIFIG